MIDNETIDEKVAEAGSWVLLLMALMVAVQATLDFLIYLI